MSRPSQIGAYLVAACLAFGPHARAVEPAPDIRAQLARARVCWAALDPECAEAALVDVRAALDSLDPPQRSEALRLSAEVALAGERSNDAHTHLLALLALEPRFAPTGWPAAWLAALAAARAAAPDRLPPDLKVSLPSEVRPKTAIAIEVRADDPSGVARCELIVADETRIALLSADGLSFRGEIPKALVRSPELLVRIEAADRGGNLATWPAQGSQRIAVTAPLVKDPPLTSRWWFWTAIGAVVAGGVVGLLVALDGADAAADPGATGNLNIFPETP